MLGNQPEVSGSEHESKRWVSSSTAIIVWDLGEGERDMIFKTVIEQRGE